MKNEKLIDRYTEENRTFVKNLKEIKETKNHYKNKILIGDGLEAMAALEFGKKQEESFKADIIMIDPPYNEDKSDGKYQDQWKGSGKDFRWAGENHGAYLDYLHPRLILGKNCLKEEGCMMLFIGDGEQHRVRLLMEMVFGEKNYVGTIIWESSSNNRQSKIINRIHEYVIIFAKNIKKFEGLYQNQPSKKDDLQNFANTLQELNYEDRIFKYNEHLNLMIKELKKNNDDSYKDIKSYKYLMPNSNIIFADDNTSAPNYNGCKEHLIHPITNQKCKSPTKGYRFSEKYLKDLNEIKTYYKLPDGKFIKILENKNTASTMGIIFGKNENTVPRALKIHKSELNKRVFKTTGYDFRTKDKKIGIPTTSGFNTVKPIEFLTEIILNYPNKNAVIVDYFAGSGTTAIATEKANEKDGGKRNWTLVEMNEDTVKDTLIPRLDYFEIDNYKTFKVRASENSCN